MNASLRPALLIVVVVPLAVCVFGSRIAWDSADLRKLIRGVRAGEELEQFRRAASRHCVSKERVLQELIAQRCSLSEALERLQELDRGWLRELSHEWPPSSAIGIAQEYRRAWSDPDYGYQWIIGRVADLLRDRPDAAAVLSRLEKDYQQIQAERQTPSTALTVRTAPHR